jgi:Nif-specific regulatory protein
MAREIDIANALEGQGFTDVKQVADGMSGIVYAARKQGAKVAVKVLRRMSEEQTEAMEHEFRLLSRMSHPCLVTVYEYGRIDADRPYFSMDWVDGASIDHAMFLDSAGQLDSRLLAEVMDRIASTLSYLHSRNLVHGDLKPGNIFMHVDDEGGLDVRLMDFGLSRHDGSRGSGLSGTIEYMAPEIIRSEPARAVSDLYSLGCVAYELISGNPPFTGASTVDILRAHLLEQPDMTVLNAAEPVKQWVGILLAKQTAFRYRSAAALRRDIGAFLGREQSDMDDAADTTVELPEFARDSEFAKIMEVHGMPPASRIVLVHGPVGAGKTHMLRDAATELHLRRETVSWLECRWDSKPLEPVRNLLERLMGSVENQPAERIAVLAESFPDLFGPGRESEINTLDPEGSKLRLFHEIIEFMRSAGLRNLLADDADNADPMTIEFLQYLAGYLQADSGSDMFLAAACTELPGFLVNEPTLDGDRMTRILLPSLTRGQTEQLLESLLGANISPSLISVLWRESEGLPGRLQALLEFCVSERIIERTPAGWVFNERENLGACLPSTEQEFLRRKISALGSSARSLLQAWSLAQQPVTLDALAAVTGRSTSDILPDAASLDKAGLARMEGAVCQQLNAALRKILSEDNGNAKKLNDRYVEWYAGRSGVPSETLALHRLHSSQPSSAFPYLLDAGHERRKLHDYAGAERLLQYALELTSEHEYEHKRFDILDELAELCDLLGNRAVEQEVMEEMLMLGARSGQPSMLARVFRRQAEFYLSAGETERAKRSTEKALGYYREAGDPMGEAWCHQKLGFCEYRSNPGEGVIRHYRQALDVFSGANSEIDEANILIDIGLVHYSVLKQPEMALDCFARARTMFESLGYSRGVARADGNTGRQLYYLGRYEEAYERFTSALAEFTRIGDRQSMAIGCHASGQCESVLGRYGEALLHLRQGLTVAIEIGNLYARRMILETMGELYHLLGMYDESIDSCKEAKSIAARTGNAAGNVSNDIDIAGSLVEQKDVDEALKLLKSCQAQLEHMEDVNVRCMFLYWSGMAYLAKSDKHDADVALAYFQQLGDLADEHGFAAHQILARSYSGQAMLATGRNAEALALSTQAMAMLDSESHIFGGRQDVFFNHARILRACRRIAEAQQFIDAAHAELMRIAESIPDVHMYRSFLEEVHTNAEIRREHALLHRTDSPHAADALRERNLRSLYEVSAKVISVLDLSQLLESIMDSALEAMNGERGLIFLLEHDQLVLKVSRNVERETIDDATEISRSILRDVVSGGKPILIADTSKNEAVRSRESVVNYNIHSIICVPMRLKDKIIGTVYVDSRADAVQALTFNDQDAEFLEAFANLASIALENAWMHEKLKEENLWLRRETQRQFGFENIIGTSNPMQRLFHEMESAISSDGSVVIFGESGTGKELVARAIHYNGTRKNARFVAVDCGAMQDTLLESELFGYKRGAFTGAYSDKRGLFEEAHNGTLFLDEISNTSLAFQAKLLRVLQEGEFRRIGDTVTRTVNVRIICATNKNIQEEIKQERFRQDLFYRLNVIPISIPPLRDRTGDIPMLVQHFIDRYNKRNNGPCHGASEEFLGVLQTMQWPGNVRELENLVSRILAQHAEGTLQRRHLPDEYQNTDNIQAKLDAELVISMEPGKRLATMNEIEREHISFVLKHTKNKTDAAAVLGLKRTTLVERMKKLGMM